MPKAVKITIACLVCLALAAGVVALVRSLAG